MAALEGWNTLIFNINMVDSKNSKMWMNQNKNTKYTSSISWIKWLHSNKEFCFTVNYRARTWRIINWPVDNVTFALQTILVQYLPIGKMNTLWQGLSWGNLFDRTLAQLIMTGQLIMTNLHCKRNCYSNNSLNSQYQILNILNPFLRDTFLWQPVGVLTWGRWSMEVVKGVAQVMGPVLVSRVTAVMTLLDLHSGLANRAESGAESNLDAFVSTFMRLFSLTASLAQLPL